MKLHTLIASDPKTECIPEFRVDNLNESLATVEQMAQFFVKAGDGQQAVNSWNVIIADCKKNGHQYFAIAQLQAAMVFLEVLEDPKSASELALEALEVIEKIAAESRLHAVALQTVGNAARLEGRTEDSQKYYQDILSFSNVADESQFEHRVAATGSLEGTQVDLGHTTDALAGLLKQLGVLKQRPLSRDLAATYKEIASTYETLNELDRSLYYYDEALKVYESVETNVPEYAQCVNDRCYVLNRVGKFDEVIEQEEWCIDYLQSFEIDTFELDQAYFNIAIAFAGKQDLDKAEEFAKKSIEFVELRRQNQKHSPDHRLSRTQRYLDRYDALILILYKQNKIDEAFEYSERVRSWSLVEMLSESVAKVRERVDDDLLRKEESLKAEVSRAYSKQLASTKPNPDILGLERKLGMIQQEIRAKYSGYSELEYPRSVKLNQVQEQLLDDGTVLLHYWVSAGFSALWIIKKDDCKFIDLESDAEQLETLVQRFRQPMEYPSQCRNLKACKDQIEAGRELYDTLFGKTELNLEETERLVISPSGVLHQLPFEALICESCSDTAESFGDITFSGDQTVFSYIPSATSLHVIRENVRKRNRAPTKDFIGFANPDFPSDMTESGMPLGPIKNSELEVRSVFQLFQDGSLNSTEESSATDDQRGMGMAQPGSSSRGPGKDDPEFLTTKNSTVYFRKAATKSRALTETPLYRYVHFATHGLVDEQNSQFSSLVLSPSNANQPDNCLLQVHEILGLELAADLVVLSACKTGLGQMATGEGMLGMTRAFFAAGASSVLVSLWNVNDEATAKLMIAFYSRLLLGTDKATALTEAKRQMKNDEKYSAPYFWAGFVLMGEWTGI